MSISELLIIVIALGLPLLVGLMLHGMRLEREFIRVLRDRDPKLWGDLGAPREHNRPDEVDKTGTIKRIMTRDAPLPTRDAEILSAYRRARRVGYWGARLIMFLVVAVAALMAVMLSK